MGNYVIRPAKWLVRAGVSECVSHEWVAGAMVVQPEDLAEVVKVRRVECDRCELEATPEVVEQVQAELYG